MSIRGSWIVLLSHPEKMECQPDRIVVVRHPDKVKRWPDRIPDVRYPSGVSYATRRKGPSVCPREREPRGNF